MNVRRTPQATGARRKRNRNDYQSTEMRRAHEPDNGRRDRRRSDRQDAHREPGPSHSRMPRSKRWRALTSMRAGPKASGSPFDRPTTRRCFDDPEIEAVVITASSGRHSELIQQAAAAGKHIFCEKPVAFDEGADRGGDCRREAAGVQLQVGFNRRFDPMSAAWPSPSATARSASCTVSGSSTATRQRHRSISSSVPAECSSTSRSTTSTPFGF